MEALHSIRNSVCPQNNKEWCYYNVNKMTINAISLLAASIVGIKISLKRRRLNLEAPMRVWSLPDLIDQLVIIICFLDFLCTLPELFYGFDPRASPFMFFDLYAKQPPDTILFLQSADMLAACNAVWHAYISYTMYAFIVLRRPASRIRRTLNPCAFVICLLAALAMYLFMWYLLWGWANGNPDRLIFLAYLTAVSDLILFPVTVLFMGFMYFRTSWVLNARASEASFLYGRYARIRRKLMTISLFVGTVLLAACICDGVIWSEWIKGRRQLDPNTWHPVFMLRAIAFRSIGLVDALIFSGVLDHCIGKGLRSTPQADMDGVTREVSLSDDTPMPASSDQPVASQMTGTMGSHIKVFVTTCNVGGCLSLVQLGPIQKWIPQDYDLYVVGLQECKILDDLRSAIHKHLGGEVEYTMYTDQIGDATILQGMIALTVWAKTSEVINGSVVIQKAAVGRVRNGVSLGPIGRAPNKGMVGIMCRYHEVSIACIAAHFAADKKGETRVVQRNRDAAKTLRMLSLGQDQEEFDCHLQSDHAILLGDLNYRITSSPEEVLESVRNSAEIERDAWRAKQGPAPVLQATTSEGGSVWTWRDKRLRDLFFSTGSEAGTIEEEEEEDDDDDVAREEEGINTNKEFVVPIRKKIRSRRSSSSSSKDEVRLDMSFAEDEGVTAVAEGGDGQEARDRQDSTASLIHSFPGKLMDIFGRSSGVGGSSSGSRSYQMVRRHSDSFLDPSLSRFSQLLKRRRSEGTLDTSQTSGHSMPRKPWRWVKPIDELSQQRVKGQILAGFLEKPIRFPPSYRWVRHRRAGDYCDFETLRACYSTKVHDGRRASQRTPSYTDRILVHSLPDRASRLFVTAYDMCDAIVGSDHRPVMARLIIGVNPLIRGFVNLAEQVSSDADSSLPIADSASDTPPVPILQEGSVNHTQLPRAPPYWTNISGRYVGALMVRTLELSTFTFLDQWHQATVVDAPEVEEVLCLFPLLSEDPFATDRKGMMLDESFLNLGSYHRPSYLGKELTLNIHRCPYSVAQSEGFRATAIVAPSFCRHALIKFIGRKGLDLGQGVICLGPMGEPTDHIVFLSSGGEGRLKVRIHCNITEKPLTLSYVGGSGPARSTLPSISVVPSNVANQRGRSNLP